MTMRSFRLKIALLSMCLSGLMLLGLGAFAVSALNRVGIERIDRELRALADAQVRQTQPPEHWQRFDESLRSVYGQDAAKQFVVTVASSDGGILHTTVDWPTDFPRDALPLPLSTAQGRGPAIQAPAPKVHRPENWDEQPPRHPDDPPPRHEPPRQLRVSGPVYATIAERNSEWRAMTIANEEVTLSIAMNLAGLNAETGRFRKALLVTVPLVLLLIIAGGWLIGHIALRPINLIARTVGSVTASRLGERVPDEKADDEFKRLISLINGMLERLERSFGQATRFSADAAHELKTPLTILQAQAEQCLQRATDGSPEQREYAEQLDEIQRLKVILRKLLLLSQADSGKMPLSPGPVNLADMVRAAAEDMRMLAPDRKITVNAPKELLLTGDAALLNQVFDNLISNAIKFGNPEGTIGLDLVARDGRAFLAVSNTGPTIPATDRDKIFERFYRADKSRSRKIEGSGLGLSLAREMARAHGGNLVLKQSEEQLTIFILTLPLSAPPNKA